MDRRKALKNLGLSLGYTVATPTLISIFQSCKNKNETTWVPDFFTKEEGDIIIKLVDLILPKTDTPSASEVNVHLFIDKFINEVIEKKEQKLLKAGLSKLISKTIKASNKETVIDLTSEDLDITLEKSLKISKEQAKSNKQKINTYKKSIQNEVTIAELNDDATIYAFTSELRDLTILGYRTSEYIGEEVLAYLPIPGEYIPCGDLEELTKGKAWSL